MLKALIKKQLLALKYSMMSGNVKNAKKANSKGRIVLFALLWAYVGIIMIAMFAYMFYTIVDPFRMLGLDTVYFSIAGLLALSVSVIVNMFLAKSLMFEAKDNELLLSLPIPTFYILLSRSIVIVGDNALFTVGVLGTAAVVYGITGEWSVGMICGTLITSVSVTLLASVLSLVLGFVVALLTANVRHKTLMTMFFSLLFLGAYFIGYSKLAGAIGYITENATGIADKMSFIGFVGKACLGMIVPAILFLLACIAVFALLSLIMSRYYIKIVTTQRGAKKVKYVEKKLHTSSVVFALVKKEFDHLFKSAVYMLNCGLGVVFMIVVGVAFLVKPDLFGDLTQVVGNSSSAGESAMLACLCAAAVICFCISTVYFSAPSISLEGKSFWLLQSLPIRTKDVLTAKLLPSLIIASPCALFASVALGICLGGNLGIAPWLVLLLVPQLMLFFVDVFGLYLGVLTPHFDWDNETYPVKQGIGVGFTLFGSWGIIIICAAVVIGLGRPLGVVACGMCVLAFLILVDAAMTVVLFTHGARKFENI